MKKLATILLLCISYLGFATILNVTSPSDNGANTLRDIVSNSSSGDTINIATSDTINLNTSISLTHSLTIFGNSAIISGQSATNIFISSGFLSISMSDLTLTNGVIATGGPLFNGTNGSYYFYNCVFSNGFAINNNGNGGAISFNSANVVFNNSYFFNNQVVIAPSPNPASSNTMHGGAVYSISSTIKLNTCTFEENSVNCHSKANGGAIALLLSNDIIVSNCTFHSNEANSNLPRISGGSAIYIGSFSGSTGKIELSNNTFSNNILPDKNGANYVLGGAVYLSNIFIPVPISISNNVFFDNSIPPSFNDSLTDFASTELISTLGHNMFEYQPTSNISIQSTDIIGQDPLLGPLQNNGGDVKTMAIPCNSPAYSTGDTSIAKEIAQNGKERKNFPDRGAYEKRIDVPSSTIIHPNCYGERNGSIELINNSFTTQYDWSRGVPVGKNKLSVTELDAGSVFLYLSESNSVCKDTISFNIIDPDSIHIQFAVVNESSGNDGTIDATVSGGTMISSPYFYLWTPNNETTEDLSGLGAGSYTLTVTDNNNCIKSKSAIVDLVTSISNKKSFESIIISPNPCTNDLSIRSEYYIYQLDVYSIDGDLIQSFNNTDKIDVSLLQNGIYTIKVFTEQGVSSKKFLKK